MSVMAVTKRTIELPTGGLVGVVRGDNLRTRCQAVIEHRPWRYTLEIRVRYLGAKH
jgi:hypothetical protein